MGFERKGNDLIHRTKISLLESLLGWKREIPHLDGRTIIVEMPENTMTEHFGRLIVEGEGMKDRRSGLYGDMVVIAEIQWPQGSIVKRQINVKHRRAIEDALGFTDVHLDRSEL